MTSHTYRVQALQVYGQSLVCPVQITSYPFYPLAIAFHLKEDAVPLGIGLHSVHCHLWIEGKCLQGFRCHFQLNDVSELIPLQEKGVGEPKIVYRLRQHT